MSNARELAQIPSTPSGRRNLIINGAMNVAQRGTSSTSGSGIRTIDRTGISWGQGAVTQNQIDLTSGDPYDAGFRHSFRMTNTTASSASSAYRQFYQYIEAQDVAQSGWDYTDSNSYLSFSFWVKSSLAGTYYIRAEAPDSPSIAQDWIDSFTVEANTWKKVSFQIAGGSTVGVDNDNNVGLSVWVAPYYGTDYSDASVSTQQWIDFSNSAQMPDFSQNWANTSNATFEITGVQLEVGSTATEFEHRSYGEELALCQRYYESSSYPDGTASNSNKHMGVALDNSGSDVITGPNFMITKRDSPTMTITGFAELDGTSKSTGTFVSYEVGPDRHLRFTIGASTTTGVAYRYHYTADAEL